MTDPVVLYTNPTSRGRIARWMLEECGASYEAVLLDYGTSMKSPEYLAINPMGKVPAIVHGENTVTETAAICAYLADAFPDAQLAPPVDQRGEYYRWLFYAAGPVESAVTNRAMQFNADDKAQTLGYGSFESVMDTLERLLAEKEYIASDSFTAADLYLGAAISWGIQFGTMDKRPGFADYVQRLTSREAYRCANELDNAAMGMDA